MNTLFSQPKNPQIKRIHTSLPIFALPIDHRTALYTPGRMAAIHTDELTALIASLRNNQATESYNQTALALSLKHHAKQAVTKWEQQTCVPFAPECLTIYLSNQCNCRCTYCYTRQQMASSAKKGSTTAAFSDINAISAAADMVITNCQKSDQPFKLVIHGGGEPTLHMEMIRQICSITRRKAAKKGVPWWSYIATNGVMTDKNARWISKNIDMVGISCDGWPEIQNTQRPLLNGEGSFPYILQTIKILHAEGTPFSIRATITRDTIHRQKEVAIFMMEMLNAKDLRFEPVYNISQMSDKGMTHNRLTRMDAERFADGFMAAEEVAKKNGARLTYAGLRPEEIHGPYCDVLRAALHMIPPAHITACFFTTYADDDAHRHGVVGRWDALRSRIEINNMKLSRHHELAKAIPSHCRNCINIFHCSRGCPQVCRVLKKNRERVSHFHCIAALRLITSRIYRYVLTEQPAHVHHLSESKK